MNTLTQTILEEGRNQAVNLAAQSAITNYATTLWTNLTSINPLTAILLILISAYTIYWFIKAIKFLINLTILILGAGAFLTIIFYLIKT